MISLRLYVDLNKCTGCRTCEVVCSFSRNRRINPRKARIEVVRVDKTGLDIPVVCVQCAKPRCAEVCPSGAILKDDVGIVRLDEEKCVGCGICADACAIGAIRIDPDSKMPLICDLCGGKPKCVDWCKPNALIFNSSPEKGKRKWQYVLSEAEKNVEKWKLPRETLDQVRKRAR